MQNLLKRFKQWLRRSRSSKPTTVMAQKLARQLAATDDVEYSCDDVLAVLDQFTEAFLRGEDVATLMPLVQRHLEMCADCHEEFEALLRILKSAAT
jgi:hypothetical protein